MAKEFTNGFYNSRAWHDCRESFIKSRIIKDGGVCEKCKDKLGYIVHHKVKLTPQNINDASITLSHENLMFVCKDCHDLIHYEDINGDRRTFCMFDENGQPIDVRETPH